VLFNYALITFVIGKRARKRANGGKQSIEKMGSGCAIVLKKVEGEQMCKYWEGKVMRKKVSPTR